MPPTTMYSLKRSIALRCMVCPIGFLAAKHSRMMSIRELSPKAQRNSSKSIGYIFRCDSSDGINISFVFSLIDKREPVSM